MRSRLSRSEADISPVKFILVSGSVVSGVGKGIISSSLGVLLKANGYRVSAIKIDPYLNIDAGTFSPFEHGEVFVLDDGGEVDLDLGNYERFLNIRLTRDNNITTGKIYNQVIQNERAGKYLGKTVQIVPHVTEAIIEWIERVGKIPVDGTNTPPHVCIIELGGTIGDVESVQYTKAFSDNLYNKNYRDRLMSIHVTYLLNLKSNGELKTKPAQNGFQKLREMGLSPDLLMCRSERPIDENMREKIVGFTQIDPDCIIDVYDVSNIYQVPLLLNEQNVLEVICRRLNLEKINSKSPQTYPTMSEWRDICEKTERFTEPVTIALVGKYVRDSSGKVMEDAYASVGKALRHAALYVGRKLRIEYIRSELLEKPKEGKAEMAAYDAAWQSLRSADGIIVPGGFGTRGFEGIIAACEYARTNKVPYLGICLGLQCAAVEFARDVCGLTNANSTEFNADLEPGEQVVIDMPEHDGSRCGMGGTMRLGKRSTVFLTDQSVLKKLYNNKHMVEERHRHRYEVNPSIVPLLSRNGLLFVGMGVDETTGSVQTHSESSAQLVQMAETSVPSGSDVDALVKKIEGICLEARSRGKNTAVRMEICEIKDHPYFVGVQYHPEYLSHPMEPSPPFRGLLLAATGQLKNFLAGAEMTNGFH